MSSQRHSELGESLRLNKQLIDEGRSLTAENTQLREMNAELLKSLKEVLTGCDCDACATARGTVAKAEKLK